MFNFFKKNKKENITSDTVTSLDLFAMVDGELIPLDKVSDPVFSQKMMGDGFAFVPQSQDVYAPCQAEVTIVFPSKHAFALKFQDVEILLHLGIDTVSLEGRPFDVKVQEGDKVTQDSLLVTADLAQIKAEEKDDVMMVIFTNGNETVETIQIDTYGPVTQGQKIGKLILKG